MTEQTTPAPEQESNALAKRVMEQRQALEKALVQTDDRGYTQIVIPPEFRQKYNVLAPAAALIQQDPYFRPGFIVIQSTPDKDFYEMTGANSGKLAMRKEAIARIANAGGVDFSRDPGGSEFGDMIPVYLFEKKVLEVKAYKYRALGTLRRSDGTTISGPAEKEWIPQQQALEIEMQASRRQGDAAAKLEWAKKEFLRSLEFRSMMTKSKAQSAVTRYFYGIEQKFSKADAAKPFLVVTYNFTAGDDPNALAIVASLVGADIGNLYGTDAPALPDAPMLVEAVAADGDTVTVDVETGEFEAEPEPEPEDAGTPEVIDDTPDMFAGVDLAAPVEEPEYLDQATAAQYRFPSGDFEGMTVGTLYHSAKGREFILRVQRGFGRLRDAGTISSPQREALRAIESYFHAVEGGV